LEGCDGPIDHYSTCKATTVAHYCIERGTVTFQCPAWSGSFDTYDSPPAVRMELPDLFWGVGSFLTIGGDEHLGKSGHLRSAIIAEMTGGLGIQCRACGFLTPVLTDTDGRFGHIAVDMYFGPNIFNGTITEDNIQGYAVYLVSGCQSKLTSRLAFVPKSNHGYQGAVYHDECSCPTTAYYASVAARMPSEGSVHVMVAPVTSSGYELPVGIVSSEIQDFRNASAANPLEAVTITQKSTMVVALEVADPVAFNASAYVEAVSATLGPDAGTVQVESVEFKVKVSYAFSNNITAGAARRAVARTAGVKLSNVDVTLRRRSANRPSAARRLSGTDVDAVIKTSEAAEVQSIQTQVSNATDLAASFSIEINETVEPPSVTSQPKATVEVRTVITQVVGSVTPPPPPVLDSAALNSVGSTLGAVVEVLSTETETKTEIRTATSTTSMTATTTGSTTTTSTITTPPQETEKLVMNMTFTGLDYDLLMQPSNAAQQAQIKQVLSDSIVITFNANSRASIAKSDIDVELLRGSVVAQATITPPSNYTAASMQSTLQTHSSQLRSRVLGTISTISGISNVTTGTLGASVVFFTQGGSITPGTAVISTTPLATPVLVTTTAERDSSLAIALGVSLPITFLSVLAVIVGTWFYLKRNPAKGAVNDQAEMPEQPLNVGVIEEGKVWV